MPSSWQEPVISSILIGCCPISLTTYTEKFPVQVATFEIERIDLSELCEMIIHVKVWK